MTSPNGPLHNTIIFTTGLDMLFTTFTITREITQFYIKLGLVVPWVLAEFYFNRGLQRLYTDTCIILEKTINGFLCLLIVFLKSKTRQLNLKDVIKLNRNLR